MVSVLNLDEPEEKALNLALNKISGDWDEFKLEQVLRELQDFDIDMDLTGFTETELEDILNTNEDEDLLLDEEEQGDVKESLADKFIIPPFSIFDARQGYWQESATVACAWN
ncbi:hypothetical protein [Bacillus haynesii]|uniref:hypothetical protein n=1 Tax=Bacillus haynesii TaxID=1925021 RepID=UPI003B987E94